VNRASIDFEDELSRHGRLFGRDDVLTEIRRLLFGERPLSRGWVLLLGSPGVGKSAILAHVLGTFLEPLTPRHFIRRGIEGWDRPELVVQNLCAQVERLYPEHRAADLPSEARLGELLGRVAKCALVPDNQRLILVIDGLDEAAGDGDRENPLPRFLPRVLPPGVVILCASRPMHAHLHWFTLRDNVHPINLDDRAWLPSNEAACRALMEHCALDFTPPLEPALVDEIVRRAGGNLLYAVKLRDWLRTQPLAGRVVGAIPQGLPGLLADTWSGIHQLDDARRALVERGLGVACAAREALTVSTFGELLGWSTTNDDEEFLGAIRPFLREEPAHLYNGQLAYRLFHDFFREFVANKLGKRAMREHHRRIAETLAAWPPVEPDALRRAYALRHAVVHRIEAGDVEEATRLCCDVGYLEAKSREVGVASVERDLEATARSASGDASLDLAAVFGAVSAESRRLRADPSSLPLLLYNRLRCAGWSRERIETVLRFPAGPPPLRLLHRVRLGTTLLRTFVGHDKPVVACVAMPDRSHFLSASADRTLRLWAIGSGECVGVLRGHDDELTACAVTFDGRTAVSASVDATVRLWDVAARRCITPILNGGRVATACTLTPDGLRVVAGSDDGTLRAWEIGSKQCVLLEGHADFITACVVTSDGQRLVSASRDGSVRVWNLASGELLFELECAERVEAPASRGLEEEHRWVTALAVTPDGRHAVAASGRGSLLLWDLASGKCVERFGAGQGRVDSCAITPDGLHLFCGIADGTIRLWSLASMRCVGHLKAHAGAVSACSATLDGRRVVSASHDRSLKLWELGAPESLVSQEGHTAPITACAIVPGSTPAGGIAVSASEDRTLKVWDLAAGVCRVTLEGHSELVTACAISADGRRVISGARDGSLCVWSIASPERIDVPGAHGNQVTGCVIASDGRLITASHDQTVRIWRLPTLGCVGVLDGHTSQVEGCVVTPDGALALSVSRDGVAKLWDLAAGTCKRELVGLGGRVLCGALTPNGQRAVLAFESGTLEVRDLRSGGRVASLRGHSGRVLGCAVSPDGSRVISASEDETIKVWSLATGELLKTLHGTCRFRCVAVTDELICAGDEEGNLWMLADGASTPSGCEDLPQRAPAAPSSGRARPAAGKRKAGASASPRGRPAEPMESAAILKVDGPANRRKTLLFLTANPSDTDPLALGREVRAVKRGLQIATLGEAFRIEHECGVRIDDLQEHMLRHRPAVVHFSGHGSSTGTLLLEGASGQSEPVGIDALADLFLLMRAHVRCVVLNACFSEAQARAIAKHIDCVIGTTGLIEDDASIAFSAFYKALGFGEDVGTAFKYACNQIRLRGLAQSDVMRLWPRDGISPSNVRLIAVKKKRT
jgi:WD40 repeat protein